MVATQNYSLYVKEAIKNGIDLIISGAGLPIELPQLAKDSKTKLVPIVSTLKGAKVLLKIWDKKSHTSPDAIIVEGPKSGGHLGFSKEQLLDHDLAKSNYDLEIKAIIELLKDYEDKYYKKIPVIVAGGIGSKEDMEDVFSLGAKGIQVASRFIPTIEC